MCHPVTGEIASAFLIGSVLARAAGPSTPGSVPIIRSPVRSKNLKGSLAGAQRSCAISRAIGEMNRRSSICASRSNRNTDVVSKQEVRVDVAGVFPLLVTKLSPYYDR